MTTTFTREDFKMAAKAAGHEVIGDLQPDDGVNVIIGGRVYLWRPAHDDGDALRLQVKLRIDLHYEEQHAFGEIVEAFCLHDGEGSCTCLMEQLGADPDAATRAAIFRAAIAIGRAMP